LTPAGTIEDVGMWAYEPHLKTYEKTKKVGTYEGDIDAIAAAEPDLIFGLEVFHKEIYDDLSALAPTVMHTSERMGAIPWKEVSLRVAETLGVKSTHDDLLADYEAAVEEVSDEQKDVLSEAKI